MQKRFGLILPILLLSTILRLYKLGSVPLGISLQEANFGIFISRFAEFFHTPFFIRLPFTLLGILSIYIFYKTIDKIFDSSKIALISSFILAIMPWHILESRVFSWGIVLLNIFLIVSILLANKIKNNLEIISKWSVSIFIICFTLLVFRPTPEVQFKVNDDRLIVSQMTSPFVARIFSNKIVESLRQREKDIFENLDFGNYFFIGHPRERGGIEESQKIFIFLLPFIFVGLLSLEKKFGLFILSWILVSFLIITVFTLKGPQTLILVIPFTLLSSLGLNRLLESHKKNVNLLTFLIIIFGLYEMFFNYKVYFSNLSESIFSPRRAVYSDLTSKVKQVKQSGQRVLVNDRLGNPETFFKFYINQSLEDYEFRSFNIWKEESKGILFVDVLPNDAGPSEPLYTKDGIFPEKLNVLGVFDDVGKRNKVLIYTIK